MNPDFRDLLLALLDADARFLLVGAYAVAIHAEPRATGDLDVWVEAAPDNARRVYSALLRFGAPLHELTEKDLATPDVVFQIGLPPRRIDVLTSITGVEFAEAWRNRTVAEIGDLRVPVIGFEALLNNKRALDRPRDRIDIELLERHRRR